MQPMEKNVEKQLVVRTFEPDMNALKQTAKQLAHMQDTSLNLYGQAGEVLIVVTARAYAQAAATELTENVAEQFELALGLPQPACTAFPAEEPAHLMQKGTPARDV